jgi:transcriptional regulator with XRE-family HTH domain
MGRHRTNVWSPFTLDHVGWRAPYRRPWALVVGDRVRRLRTARRWTLQDLAFAVRKPEGGHYSAAFVSRLERGWSSPPLYAYLVVAEALEVPPGKLLGRGELERELTPGEGVLVMFLKRMGITPEEAVVRLACEGRDLGEPAEGA